MSEAGVTPSKPVRQFRQILLWPVQLMPIREGAQIQRHWELLERADPANPWREVLDEFSEDPSEFHERHYNEVITFLPHVQRFLYGEGRANGREGRHGGSPVRVFRRQDVSEVRITLRPGEAPRTLGIKHVDLYFFYDIDVVILNVEVFAQDLALSEAQELLYSFGRAYPANWDEHGNAVHCPALVEWLAADGRVLAASDFHKRDKFLGFVCRHRAAAIAAHWAFLLRPLVLDSSDEGGLIRFRQLEYYRMPAMGYLAVDDPHRLSRSDFVRLGLVTAPGTGDRLPYAEQHCADFEATCCYDRYWSADPGAVSTRFMTCGHALVIVGDARSALFTDDETGVQSQFRHQYFLLFLIAHMQRAALLMFANRLAEAVDHLDIHDAESVKRFKRVIRQNFEIFLRFTHRYWFHDLSDQAQMKALFQMCSRHLGTDPLYAEVKQEIFDMSQYLDSDSIRRQANTVLRLTVVTTFGLVGTVATGFLGMNLLAEADRPLSYRLLLFLLVLVPTVGLTFYTIVKSKRLSDFLEALSDENLTLREKMGSLLDVWRKKRDDDELARERA